MLNKIDKKQLVKIRKILVKELKRMRVSEPKMSIQLDYKTKKLKLVYGVYEDKGIDIKGERIIKKKQKNLYLKNVSLYDDELFKINLNRYVEEVQNRVSNTIKHIGTSKDSLEYWIKLYTSNPNRVGNLKVTQKTLKQDELALKYLTQYLEKEEPKMLTIWNWIDNGRKIFVQYVKYKQQVTTKPNQKCWSNGTVLTNYQVVRAFFNWIPNQIEGFPQNLLNRLPFTPNNEDQSCFSPRDISVIKDFIKKNKGTRQWGWFISMLVVMLETGCRVIELVNMKIEDIEPSKRIWRFKGKGRHGGKTRTNKLNQYTWDMILDWIVDEDGKIRTDKEYVFHKRFYKHRDKIKYPNSWILTEDIHAPVSHNGYRSRFKKFIKILKLDVKLTPHSCRRYYITEMLRKTNGNIPLVADLVGHESWDMVKRYAKTIINEDTQTNVGLFDDENLKAPISLTKGLSYVMITPTMKKKLLDLQYTEEKIESLTPNQAHEIIVRGF